MRHSFHHFQKTIQTQGVVAMVYTHYSSGVALPGSIEATVGLVAVGLGIIQQLM